MGKYIPLDGFTTKLIGKLPAKDRYVPIFDTTRDRLLRELSNAGDYSYFILKDGNTIEAVKIENYCGRLLMTRGLERTTSECCLSVLWIGYAKTMPLTKS